MPTVPDTAAAAATLLTVVLSSAAIKTVPRACTLAALAPMWASVVMLKTCTPALTETPAVPPMAMPAETDVTSSSESAVTEMSPSASMVTPDSVAASVVLLIDNTSAPMPAPAVPPAAIEPATETMLLRSEACSLTSVSSAGVAAFCAFTVAPWPTVAEVSSPSTMTVAAPATPTVPAAPPAAVIEIRSSVDVAPMSTPMAPADVTWARLPTRASTVSMCTSVVLATPTPALLPTPTAPAISRVSSVPSARTVTLPPACRMVEPDAASST